MPIENTDIRIRIGDGTGIIGDALSNQVFVLKRAFGFNNGLDNVILPVYGAVDVISSLTLITTGLGLTVSAESFGDDTNRGLILIPVATAIAGSIFGHRSVKGVHFTSRQGSTISIASGGAALIGLGAVALAEADAAGWYFGSASVCALIMHQVLFSSYKKKNLEQNIKMGQTSDHPIHFSMNVMPENYFMQKQMTEKQFLSNPSLTYPLVSMKLAF